MTAVASWVDNFKLPLKEIKRRYTKSDLTVLAWNSRLQSYNMTLGFDDTPAKAKIDPSSEVISPIGVKETEDFYVLPDGVNNGVPIKKKLFNEEGELDLRKATGAEAASYIKGLGIPLAIIPNKR